MRSMSEARDLNILAQSRNSREHIDGGTGAEMAGSCGAGEEAGAGAGPGAATPGKDM